MRNMQERAIVCGRYIAETGCTVRACAEKFGMSKSTVHKDTERLEGYDRALYERVRRVLGVNLKERHLRGGDATRRMYARRREQEKSAPHV